MRIVDGPRLASARLVEDTQFESRGEPARRPVTFIAVRLWKCRFGNSCEAGFARARQTETEPAGTRVKNRSLLLRADIYRCAGGVPIDLQSAAAARLSVGDGEILDRRGQLRNLHVHAGEFVALVFIRYAPFPCLFVDDERPLIGLRDGENRIAAGRNRLAADD